MERSPSRQVRNKNRARVVAVEFVKVEHALKQETPTRTQSHARRWRLFC